MKFYTLILFATSFYNVCFCQIPNTKFGKIIRYDSFNSKFVSKRNVDVWLPDNFLPNKTFGVLYMHDGQMIFDSSISWNKQAWMVQNVLHNLQSYNKQLKQVIIVGIHNSGSTRHSDYFPEKPFNKLSKKQKAYINNILTTKGKTKNTFVPQSNNYLKFIVEELKPFIDSTFNTISNQQNTFICGSSMGGLISMYAICEYPNIFGGAACLSTHWTGIYSIDSNPIPNQFFKYLKKNLPSPKDHKIYFDYGNKTLDSLYPPLQQKVDVIMQKKGYNLKNWKTQFFEGENHSEKAWNKRLHIPLEFILSKEE
ncbi:MAG: alpha/beta hydrolase [Chitinophagaceae bacterium]